MPRKSLQTNQEKLLYASKLLGIDKALELVEGEIRSCTGANNASHDKDDSKVIMLKSVK